MAAGDLNIALILKLVDQATGPARAVTNSLRQIGAVTEQTGRAGVVWANEQLAANQARRAALQGEAMGLLALGGGLVALTEPAIQAERQLAEISKVVEFEAPDGLQVLQNDIRNLVTSGGLATTADGVSDIVAAAGRMGVVDANLPDAAKRRELLEFATAASKMAVAFGISADEAGTSLARWRQNLGLSQDEALALGDTINLLGNTMATNEADILQVINRQGVVAQSAGLASNEIAALSATLLAAGASPEIAATGLKNFTNALTRGESATARQSAVFDALGIDAVELAQRMQTDATGGILSVLDAFEEIEPYRRSSMVGDLFGEEAKGAIMPLIENADLLRRTFERTADTAALLGLMEEEYQRQAETTFAQRQRLFEYLKGLSVVVGSTVLPILNELMEQIMPIIKQVTDWAAAHPELIQMIFKVALALFAFKLASIALRWTLFSLLTPFLKLVKAGSWLLRLLPGIASAMRLLKPLKWALLVPKLLWSAFIGTIPWVALAGKLAWRGLVAPLIWGQRLVSKIPWMRLAVSGKPFALRTLVTALKWGTRLIPVIGWALLAGELLWHLLIKPLGWDKYLPAVDWEGIFGAFSWDGWIPEIDWGRIIGSISWPEPPRWLKWLVGEEQVAAPLLSDTPDFAALPQEQQDAVRAIESIGPVLPTEGYQLELQLREDELRRQIADLQASITPPPEAFAYVQELQNAQADLAFAQELISEARAAGDQTELATLEDEARALEALIANRQAMIASLTENGTQGQELARLETELAAVIERQAQAKVEADALTQALMVINETEVRPDIDTASIDEALVKARRLSALLQNSSGVAAASAANPDGARDRGGPVRAGMPYLVGERSPEIFVPGVSGTILPGRVLKAAMAASAMAAPVTAMPSQAEIVETLDRRPVMSAPAAAPQITREGDTVTINIYPTQGMSVEDIGREVERRLARREDARRADLHDGVDY